MGLGFRQTGLTILFGHAGPAALPWGVAMRKKLSLVLGIAVVLLLVLGWSFAPLKMAPEPWNDFEAYCALADDFEALLDKHNLVGDNAASYLEVEAYYLRRDAQRAREQLPALRLVR